MATPYPLAMRHFPVLRQSTLARFADCQLSAGFELRLSLVKPGRFGLHRSGWTTHRQAAGRLIHSTLARALEHMIERREERIATETIIDIWDDELRQARARVEETFALPAHEDALARRTLRKWARDNVITIADVAGVEERLKALVTYPDGAGGLVERTITGQLDLLLIDPTGRHATVVDYKDTWRLPAASGADEELEDEEDDGDDDTLSVEGYFQQRCYGLQVFAEYPRMESVTLREYYLRRSRPREATIWRHQVPDLLAYFGALAERWDRCYEASALTRRGRLRRRVLATPVQWGEPSPGAHCSYCPMGLDCPLGPEAREGGMAGTPAEAQRLAGMLLVARRAVAMLDRSVRTWADKEGPVRVRDAKRDRFFGYVESLRVERPTLRQVDDAMLAGRDPRELYRQKVHTRFSDFSPDADVSVGPSDDDVVAMFERAAEAAKSRRSRTRRRARA